MAPPALPAVGAATRRIPNSLALLMAMAIPRALKLPVGKRLSSFTQSSRTPNAAASRGVETSGVTVSPSDTILAGSLTGSNSRYRHIVCGRSARSRLENAVLRPQDQRTHRGRWHFTHRPCTSCAS